MTWTAERIRAEWLGGAQVPLSDAVLVDSFDRVERLLGEEWLESIRQRGGMTITGTMPTLTAAHFGRLLSVIERVPASDALIAAVRDRNPAAIAELEGIYLLTAATPHVRVELYPTALVAGRSKQPDFRVRLNDEPWTYVEVTRPDTSELHDKVVGLLTTLSKVCAEVPGTYAIEVFFRREPRDPEVDTLLHQLRRFCHSTGTRREEIADGLGFLCLNFSEPGRIVPADHPGEPNVPRLGMAQAIMGPEGRRHIAVRLPFADERAETFLSSEAKQLPKDACGLIMVDMLNAIAGMKTWRPLLLRRFQPSMHTRVGGVGLFQWGMLLTPQGEATLPDTSFVSNPYAALPLPAWIPRALEQAGAEARTLHQAQAKGTP